MGLSDTQLVILSAAAQRDDLRVTLPERLRGGAAEKVLTTLLGKGLIETVPDEEIKPPSFGGEAPPPAPYRITDAGLAAMGLGGEAPVEKQPVNSEVETGAGDTNVSAPAQATTPASATSPRAGSKLARAMALLERPNGASIDELTTLTGWLPHTTRAALTGLRKRGVAIERGKRADGGTTYRIPAAIDPAEVI